MRCKEHDDSAFMVRLRSICRLQDEMGPHWNKRAPPKRAARLGSESDCKKGYGHSTPKTAGGKEKLSTGPKNHFGEKSIVIR
jgi:hypothetical protein